METFLADYGLVWVGSNRSESDTGSDSEDSNIEKIDSEYDWNKIIRNVQEGVLYLYATRQQVWWNRRSVDTHVPANFLKSHVRLRDLKQLF